MYMSLQLDSSSALPALKTRFMRAFLQSEGVLLVLTDLFLILGRDSESMCAASFTTIKMLQLIIYKLHWYFWEFEKWSLIEEILCLSNLVFFC